MMIDMEPTRVREASELLWPPGYFPKVCDLGKMVDVVHMNGELGWVDYFNVDTEELTRVFND